MFGNGVLYTLHDLDLKETERNVLMVLTAGTKITKFLKEMIGQEESWESKVVGVSKLNCVQSIQSYVND